MNVGNLGVIAGGHRGNGDTQAPSVDNTQFLARWVFGDTTTVADPVTNGVSFVKDLTGNGYDAIQNVNARQPRMSTVAIGSVRKLEQGNLVPTPNLDMLRTAEAHTYFSFGIVPWDWIPTDFLYRAFWNRAAELYSDGDWSDDVLNTSVSANSEVTRPTTLRTRSDVTSNQSINRVDLPETLGLPVMIVCQSIKRAGVFRADETTRVITPDGQITETLPRVNAAYYDITIDRLVSSGNYFGRQVDNGTDALYEVAVSDTIWTDEKILAHYNIVKGDYGL